jgi:peptide/nickel transport system permease protein
MGIVSATHNNRPADHVSRLIALLGYSMPLFVFGFILQLVLGLYVTVPRGGFQFGVFPISTPFSTTCGICVSDPGQVAAYTGAPLFDGILSGNAAYTWDALVALVLPAFTLAFTTIGALTRIIRSSMLEALRQDYILLARSKGLRNRVVVYRHALRNALLPAVTVAGLITAGLFSGVVIIETVFAWPGIGAAGLQAALSLDLNFQELYILATAAIIVVANLSVDILYAVLDPRIRY